MNSQIVLTHALRSLSEEELQTCKSIVNNEKSAKLYVMPTHHLTAFGDFSGFHYVCDASASGNCLPISRDMFFGHTLVECQESEETIWRLILNQQENKKLLQSFLQDLRDKNNPALLDHAPENTGYMSMYNSHCENLTQDSGVWAPDVPETIGIYHAMVRGFNRENREHKLYIVCSSGLEKASDEFCNLLIDVGKKCDAYTVAVSDEVWWLKRACKRARCSLIYQLACKFGLSVHCIEDTQSKDPNNFIAVHTVDSVEHDIIYDTAKKQVSVLNGCLDTTRSVPGVMVKMHPAEGYWLFRSDERHGKLTSCVPFPARQPVLKEHMHTIPVCKHVESNKIVWTHDKKKEGNRDKHEVLNYMCFDESYIKTLQDMRWDRNNGIIELVPIAVLSQ